MKKPTVSLIEETCRTVGEINKETIDYIFRKSPLPMGYFFNKWFRKKVSERDFPSVYINMDDKHRNMFTEYVCIGVTVTEQTKEETEDTAFLIACWFMFCYNFTYEFWENCFGAEKDKYIKMAGKPVKGFVATITSPMICKLFLKLTQEQKERVVKHAFEEYQDYEKQIGQWKENRQWMAGVKAKAHQMRNEKLNNANKL